MNSCQTFVNETTIEPDTILLNVQGKLILFLIFELPVLE